MESALVTEWDPSATASAVWPTSREPSSLLADDLAIRRTYPRAGEPWTSSEEGTVADAVAHGASILEVAAELGREPSAVAMVLRRLDPAGARAGFFEVPRDEAPEGYEVVEAQKPGLLTFGRNGGLRFNLAKRRALTTAGSLLQVASGRAWVPRRRLSIPEYEKIVAVAIPTGGLPTERAKKPETMRYDRRRLMAFDSRRILDRDGCPLQTGDQVLVTTSFPDRRPSNVALWPRAVAERVCILEGVDVAMGAQGVYLKVQVLDARVQPAKSETRLRATLLLARHGDNGNGPIYCELRGGSVPENSYYHAIELLRSAK